ncbi:unnamed protein product, partial [Ectocarpus sp. 12 AP-2014]
TLLCLFPLSPPLPCSPWPPPPHILQGSRTDRYQATPTVTRAIAGGTPRGMPSALVLLWVEEDVAGTSLVAQPFPDEPPLPDGPARNLETPATHTQAHAGWHSAAWGAAEKRETNGLVAVGTFEPAGGL